MQLTKGWVKYSITFTHPAAGAAKSKNRQNFEHPKEKVGVEICSKLKFQHPLYSQLAPPAMRGIFGFFVWSKTTSIYSYFSLETSIYFKM